MNENPALTTNGKSEARQWDELDKQRVGERPLCSGHSTALQAGDQGPNTSSVTSCAALTGCLPSGV